MTFDLDARARGRQEQQIRSGQKCWIRNEDQAGPKADRYTFDSGNEPKL